MTERNWLGLRTETIAAEYETDAVLAEWMAEAPRADYDWPPPGHYFWAALNAEHDLRVEDQEWLQENGSARGISTRRRWPGSGRT